MKTIQPVSIWANGQTKQAKILNAYAVNVTLNTSATFYYSLLAQTTEGAAGDQLAQGNIQMDGQDYQDWDNDDVAWDFIAAKLGLTITGDYTPPAPAAVEPTPAP